MQASHFENRLLQAGRYAALCALFCVPVSVAAVNIFAALIALLVLVNPLFWRECKTLGRIPVIGVSLMLILALSVSTFYSSATIGDATRFAFKEQKKLLLIVLAIWLFRNANLTRQASLTIFISLTLTLLLSCVNYYSGANLFNAKSFNAEYASGVVFHNYISQSILTAFLFSLSIYLSIDASTRIVKTFFLIVAVMAALNVMLILNGRSGQLAFIIVIVYMLILMMADRQVARLNKARIISISILFVGLLMGAAIQNGARMTAVGAEINAGVQGSSGQRLAFYKLSWDLIKESPFIGYGAGSLEYESSVLVKKSKTDLTWAIRNPHNEYLFMSIQMGLIGLLIYLYFLYKIFRESLKLPQTNKKILTSFLVIFSSISFINSLLLDFVEGHLFVLMVGIFLAPLYASKPQNQRDAVTVS